MGLNGSTLNGGSGIIIPYPGKANKYVIISSMKGNSATSGLFYSVLDMNLDDGLGDIVQKGIRLGGYAGYAYGAITAIRHANGRDYWVVAPTHPMQGTGALLNAWLVTPDGVSSTPEVTLTFDIAMSGVFNQVKFSPDGRYFGWATGADNFMYGEFNSATGVFSHIQAKYVANCDFFEFSPSGKNVYISGGINSVCLYI
jgi:hypothetical protein